jgi:hypothetical protein
LLSLAKNVAVGLAITLLLLFVLNVAAWFYLSPWSQDERGWKEQWQIHPMSRKGIEIRKRIFDTDDEVFLAEVATSPAIRPHTVLHFTNGFSQPQYTVGIEGIRYLPGWSDKFVERELSAGNGIFVFGGSTTWGHGVPDDMTLVRYLGEINPGINFFNFGTNAYDSLREVDRLVYLLRKGYRPKAVIFVDGLNDFTTFASTPYRAQDKPRTQGFLIDRGDLTLTFGVPVLGNMLKAFAYAMPMTHVFFKMTETDPAVPYGSLDPNTDPLNYRMLAWYYTNQFSYADQNMEAMIADWVTYYRRNIDFVRTLGKAFNFEAYFIMQPLGVVERNNQFLTPAFFESPGFKMGDSFTRGATDAIASGVLDMIDCQGAFAALDASEIYVDQTHYSPQGNRALAECITRSVGMQF